MQLISYITQIYFSKRIEDFTEKMIAALGIFQAIELTDEGVDDYSTIKWIEENTHKDVMVSIYKLDRNINPTKESVKNVVKNVKLKFLRNDSHDTDNIEEKSTIEMTDDTAQYYLCKAIRTVNDLVIKNIKSYSDEIKMPDMMIDGGSASIEFGELDVGK